MTDDVHKNPGLFKHLLSIAALVVAVLIGFVLGLQFGDRTRRDPSGPGKDGDVETVDTLAVAAVDTVVIPEEPEPEKAQDPSKKDITQGVEYLAANNRWNRDEMEQIPALQGLWDAVNTYSLDQIRTYNDILGSTPLTTIVEGLEKKPKTGYYAAKNDHVITLSTYVKRLR